MESANRYRATGLGQFIATQGRQRDWVAAQAGVHPSLITHLLAGRRTVSEPVAQRIASALGAPFPLLFERSEGSRSLAQEQVA